MSAERIETAGTGWTPTDEQVEAAASAVLEAALGVEEIARVLGEHAPEEANYEVWFCECDPGGREDAVQRTTAEHAHHQADALIAHLTGGAR